MRKLITLIAAVSLLGGALASTAAASSAARLTFAAKIAAAPVAQTTTLVTPSGAPVSGQWQQWMNEDRMPSYRGTMVLDVSTADVKQYCWSTAALACTAPTASQLGACASFVCSDPETVIDPNAGNGQLGWWTLRDILFYEQAHVLDFAYLTDPQRESFLQLWGRHQGASAWWANESTLTTDSDAQVPGGEMLSEGYRVCAEGLSLAQEPYLGYQLASAPQRQETQFCAMVRHDLRAT